MTAPITITLYGAPRTKKNSSQFAPKGNTGRPLIFPSPAWRKWLSAVKKNHGKTSLVTLPDVPYNCAALFYRDRLAGDAVGYYQGLADLLEEWGLLSNDKLITQWDGSRMLIDREFPRVELTLTPVSEGTP